MSFSAVPALFRLEVIRLIMVLASVWAALTVGRETVIPRLTMAVSGMTVTLPVPVTVNKSCF